MPTPDGREWLSPQKIGLLILVGFIAEFKGEDWFDGGVAWDYTWDIDVPSFDVVGSPSFPTTCMLGQPGIKQRFWDVLRNAYANSGYIIEFKICRLTEKLKDAVAAGQWPDGEPVDVLGIREAFDYIYNIDTLNSVDEDGNPL